MLFFNFAKVIKELGNKMNQNDLLSMSLGEIAVKIPAAWDIFEKEGSDFCFCSYDDLQTWATNKNMNPLEIAQEILDLRTARTSQWTNENSLTVICDHIMKEFHQTQRRQISQIQTLISQTVSEMNSHPGLMPIVESLNLFIADLLKHFDHEEQELFVELREIDIFHPIEPAQAQRMQFGQISNQMRYWEGEHTDSVKIAETILCDLFNFMPAHQGPKSYKDLYELLNSFFADLRKHIHFENFVLLPACMKVEQALSI